MVSRSWRSTITVSGVGISNCIANLNEPYGRNVFINDDMTLKRNVRM